MSLPFQPRSAPRWPFWLLVFAWICANSPQNACFEVISWAQGATSFSHQERLVSGVTELLDDYPAEVTALAAAPVPEPATPAIPAGATIKKIELATTDRSDPAGPACAHMEFPGWLGWQPAVWIAEVPYPPPRDVA